MNVKNPSARENNVVMKKAVYDFLDTLFRDRGVYVLEELQEEVISRDELKHAYFDSREGEISDTTVFCRWLCTRTTAKTAWFQEVCAEPPMYTFSEYGKEVLRSFIQTDEEMLRSSVPEAA
ncbi:MAG: hypothetical protein AAB914_04595 [Patescibacteria group bacterium]